MAWELGTRLVLLVANQQVCNSHRVSIPAIWTTIHPTIHPPSGLPYTIPYTRHLDYMQAISSECGQQVLYTKPFQVLVSENCSTSPPFCSCVFTAPAYSLLTAYIHVIPPRWRVWHRNHVGDEHLALSPYDRDKYPCPQQKARENIPAQSLHIALPKAQAA